jgi:hypothetical protein
MSKIEISNIFEWLDEITIKKSHPNLFTENSWDKWNSYMIHRWISQDFNYIDIANHVQKINPQNKKEIYLIYRELIPKKKIWFKYIKNENKPINQELINYFIKYFQCSSKEVSDYITILTHIQITDILKSMGVEEKEILKLTKELKWKIKKL